MNRKYTYNTKEYNIKDRLEHKGIYCISTKWIKWAKRYLNRIDRRKNKKVEVQADE